MLFLFTLAKYLSIIPMTGVCFNIVRRKGGITCPIKDHIQEIGSGKGYGCVKQLSGVSCLF